MYNYIICVTGNNNLHWIMFVLIKAFAWSMLWSGTKHQIT